MDSPLQSLEDVVSLDSRDWSFNRKDAWIYGIVVGWENNDPLEGESTDDALDSVCEKFSFDKGRLKMLRKEYLRIKESSLLDSVKQQHIIDAYVFLRKNNHSLPDDVLDFIKDVCLEHIQKSNFADLALKDMASLIESEVRMAGQGKRVLGAYGGWCFVRNMTGKELSRAYAHNNLNVVIDSVAHFLHKHSNKNFNLGFAYNQGWFVVTLKLLLVRKYSDGFEFPYRDGATLKVISATIESELEGWLYHCSNGISYSQSEIEDFAK